MSNHQPSTVTQPSRRRPRPWLFDLLLIYVLLIGAYVRFTGLFWGDYQYLHPDERFLVWVGTDISPVNSLAEYFNTAQSTLNPNNVGHGFYVYGTLPMLITRYLVQWIYGHSGFMEMTNVGRALSALADLLTVLLVFQVAERLYDKRVALLSAAFSAVAVLQIQQSHFFTMDTFINFFSFLAFYFAVRVMLAPKEEPAAADPPGIEFASGEIEYAAPARSSNLITRFVHDPI
jgi:4-amino-4-deoxy-L-arabinose transferase-like glycosyltransferase